MNNTDLIQRLRQSWYLSW